MKYFGTVRQKLRRKIVIPPPSIQTFSIPEIIATVKDSPTEIFGTVRQKTFDGKSWYSPPPLIQTFSVPEISETLKGSPTKFFGTVRQKNFRRKVLISPPLLSKLFRYPKLLQQLRIPLRKFSALWDKKLSTENLDTPPPPSYPNFFGTRN